MQRITIDPAICHGKPNVRGLRYPVETILELLSSGMTYDEILADYEDLEREDILAVLAYTARLSQVKRIETLAAASLARETRSLDEKEPAFPAAAGIGSIDLSQSRPCIWLQASRELVPRRERRPDRSVGRTPPPQ